MQLPDAFGGVYAGRTVLVTGHTGFKGAWLCHWLGLLGARVAGFSDRVPTNPSLFETAGIADRLRDHRGDICDAAALAEVFETERPQVVFHLAAQPIVRQAYEDPVETVRTNVLGTVQLLETARRASGIAAVVVVTSDKCYDNRGTPWPYRETDMLGGHEPYAASKAAAEIVSAVYMSSTFHTAASSKSPFALATARAGNVIGGGDWARDRLIPDLVASILAGNDIVLRAPTATRPWQHVLEPLSGYLWLMALLLHNPERVRGAWNFGPGQAQAWTVRAVAEEVIERWQGAVSRVLVQPDMVGKEAHALRIDSSKAAAELGWTAAWDTAETIGRTIDWYRAWSVGEKTLGALCSRQIADYEKAAHASAWTAGRWP